MAVASVLIALSITYDLLVVSRHQNRHDCREDMTIKAVIQAPSGPTLAIILYVGRASVSPGKAKQIAQAQPDVIDASVAMRVSARNQMWVRDAQARRAPQGISASPNQKDDG
jgi:hypothetical protein